VFLKNLIDGTDLGRQIAIGDGNDEVAAYTGYGRILAENATGCCPLAKARDLSGVDARDLLTSREPFM